MTSGRPRAFSVGAMRDRVDIQQATESVDDIGQTIRTWSTLLYREPCNWTQVSGGEFVRGKQIEAQIRAIGIVKYRANTYTPEMRVVVDGVAFGIVHVLPVEGLRKYIQLECKAVSNGA